MSLKDLELEDGLKDVGNMLASPPGDLQQLLLLLDKAETFLSRVEQSPSASMSAALQPALKALVAKDLLRHSDVDVKVAIASCLSEITRITAPDAPFDDDLMKEIFGLIVGAFKNLDEMSSHSFPKRVSILETVAKIRSCVLMLDLDCDDLILEMFHHFLRTIRSKHSDTVFSSMVTVMTLVIEETESISARLLSGLLDCVKNVEKNTPPLAKKLAEKVLVNCSLMLKPYLAELFNGSAALLSDYSKIVAAVLQGNLDTSMQNEMNASGENQGSAQREGEVFHPENAVVAADRSSKSVTSNETFQIGNGDSMASKQKTEHSHHSDQSRGTIGASLSDSDILDSGTEKQNSRSDLISSRGGRKALLKLPISNDHFQIGNKKEVPATSGRRRDSSKEADFSQAHGPSKEVESVVRSKTEKNELELTSSLPDAVASVYLHNPNEHDGSHHERSLRHKRAPHHKRGQPSQSKSPSKKNAVGSGSCISRRKEFLFSSQATSGELPTRDLNLKELEVVSDLKRKRIAGSTKKSRSGRAKDIIGSAKDCNSTQTTATCDSDTMLLSHSDSDTKLLSQGRNGSRRQGRKAREVNFSEKKQSAGTKQQKGVKHAESEDKDLKLKELLSSEKSTVKELIKDQSHVKDTAKRKSRRKRARGAQETFGRTKRRKGLNGTLVGSKIKVWWPDDKRFYDGVVDSFDRRTKMHKILYDDGDVEVLILNKEQWEFIEGVTKMDGEKDTPDISASEIPDSTGKSGHVPKRRGKSRVKIHSHEVKKTRVKSRDRHPEESHKDNNQTKEAANNLEDDTPKMSRRIKHAPSKIREDKVDKDTPKRQGESKGDSRSSRKSKNNIQISVKKSGDAYDSGSKSMEVSPKPKSAEGRRKPRRRLGEGFGQKAKGGMPSNSQSKLGKTDTGTTSGMKRKRGRRLGK